MADDTATPPAVSTPRAPIVIVGRPGLAFNINGSGFGDSGSLSVGGVVIPTTAWTDTRIKGQLPLGQKAGSIEVTTPTGKQAGIFKP